MDLREAPIIYKAVGVTSVRALYDELSTIADGICDCCGHRFTRRALLWAIQGTQTNKLLPVSA